MWHEACDPTARGRGRVDEPTQEASDATEWTGRRRQRTLEKRPVAKLHAWSAQRPQQLQLQPKPIERWNPIELPERFVVAPLGNDRQQPNRLVAQQLTRKFVAQQLTWRFLAQQFARKFVAQQLADWFLAKRIISKRIPRRVVTILTGRVLPHAQRVDAEWIDAEQAKRNVATRILLTQQFAQRVLASRPIAERELVAAHDATRWKQPLP